MRRAPVPAVLLASLIVATTVGAATFADDPPSLADELPRIPAVEPDDALETFVVQHGFSLTLVAHEPLVSDPVDACFDARGRLYVAEMHGYPYSEEVRAQQPEPIGKHDAGIIRLLTDTDGDGLFDQSTQFADGFSWPTSVCCYDGGVFVIAAPNLWYFKDTDDDGVADVREIRLSGFSRANVQALANNLKWGLDNRIYAAGGTNNDTTLKRGDEDLGSLRGKDFCFDPRTMQLEFLTGGRQFGHSMDDWGNRFVCSNSNHIQHVVFPLKYLNRTPGVTVSAPIRSIAAEGPAAPVFRTSPAEPWRIVRTRRRAADPAYRDRLPATELVPVGFFTSATGVTIYRGDAYPPEFRGNAFIGDVGANMIHRKTLAPDGISFIATRADEGVEFITSTDNWFRPVNFVNGPDGCLYILDMYRETIEHPYSIPEDIKQYLDLESGDDRGRIWRLDPPASWHKPFADLADMSTGQLVAQLQSANGWNRETAQRLLWERQDQAAVPGLKKLTAISAFPTARLHALYTLEGLGALDTDTLIHSLADENPRVREHAIRLAEAHSDEALIEPLSALADDPDVRVRWQLALTMGEFPQTAAQPILSRLAARESLNPEVRQAMLTSLRESLVPAVFSALERANNDASGASAAWLSELCVLVGSDAKTDGTIDVLTRLADAEQQDATADVVLAALGRGLARQSRTFEKLAARDGTSDSVRSFIESRFAAAMDRAMESHSPDRQADAIALLRFAPLPMLTVVAEELSWPQMPAEVQIELARSLSGHPEDVATDYLLSEWRALSPAVRSEAVDGVMRSPARINSLLKLIENGDIRPSELATDKRQLLLTHPDESVRARAAELFEAASADRQQVIADYEPALDHEPDLAAGRQVFAKTCINCHRVGEEGHNVGPDLASVSNKSARDLLVAILDPNREAQPNYTNYTVALLDGRVVTGIIVNETADTITLRRAEGKEDVVLRSQIDILQSTGLSLMPIGLEKDISPAQLADVIAFIKSIPAARAPSQ